VSEFEPYVRAWRARWEREAERDREAAAVARETAQRLAVLLRDRYGATRVVLTGSLARGDFRRGSDLDLAVAGIRPDAIFGAGASLEYLHRVQQEGVVLHDARPD
jgi:predicted nucleotidyltransferase